MKERPIPLKQHEVRGILDGRQSQLRRIVKSPSWSYAADHMITVASDGIPRILYYDAYNDPPTHDWKEIPCRYGQPGDRLWGQETLLGWWSTTDGSFSHAAAYKADGYELEPGERWIPSTQMPRAASRINLEITGVRVERLQDISSEDAEAEGVKCYPLSPKGFVEHYRDLWGRINGPGSWEANPWVWVVEFKRIDAQALKAA